MIKLTRRLPQSLHNSSVLFSAIFGVIATELCRSFIIDAPLLLALAESACYLPFWICVIWQVLALSGDSLLKMSISGLLWRLALVILIGGFGALYIASDIYFGAAAELRLRDTSGASIDAIQAMHEQSYHLFSLSWAWMAFGLGIGAVILIFVGVIWIRRNLNAAAAVKKDLKPDVVLREDKVFVVGDRRL